MEFNLDSVTGLVTLMGVLVSMAMQIVKRRKAGFWENVVVVSALALGAGEIADRSGHEVQQPMVAVFAFAFHGLVRAMPWMEHLHLGIADRIAEAVGDAFRSMSSEPVKPPPP